MLDDETLPDLYQYIHADLLLPQQGDHMQESRVIGNASDINGNKICQYDVNPILHTHLYHVMIPYG